MRLPFVMLQVAGLLAAAAAGWVLRGQAGDVAAPPVAAPRVEVSRAPARQPDVPTQPLIAVAGDGRVTLRVEQQPLEWVLDEIERQSGLRRPQAGAASGTAAVPTSVPAAETCPMPEAPSPTPDQAAVLLAIENGSENERHDALLRARDEGLTLAPALLRTLVETGASERVRLRALEAWVEQNADQPTVVRRMLEGVVHMPGAELTQEAQRLLAELNQSEQVDPADTQSRNPP